GQPGLLGSERTAARRADEQPGPGEPPAGARRRRRLHRRDRHGHPRPRGGGGPPSRTGDPPARRRRGPVVGGPDGIGRIGLSAPWGRPHAQPEYIMTIATQAPAAAEASGNLTVRPRRPVAPEPCHAAAAATTSHGHSATQPYSGR